MVGVAFMVGGGLYGRGRPLWSGAAFGLKGGLFVKFSHAPHLLTG